jgi:hypothetical protein
LHLLQFAEMAIPTLAAIFLEIDALIIILVGMICLVLHEDTASRGTCLRLRTREVMPIEQHIHSFLECCG